MAPVHTLSAARQRLGSVATVTVAALLAACESSGPRTGSLKLNIEGLPSGTAAQVTVSGPESFSRVLTGSDVIASLKPGKYLIAGASVLNGSTRYSPSPDTQRVTIGKSNTPVEVTVAYRLTTGSLALTVAGAPDGSSPTVRVTGPRGFDKTVNASTLFEGLDVGTYTIAADELVANQHRFAPIREVQSVTVLAEPTPKAAFVQYTQTTGNLTVNVTGLPAGVAGNVSIIGPGASYTVGESSDFVGVRAGSYTVNAGVVTAGADAYLPNSYTQTVAVPAAGSVTVAIIYANSGPLNFTIDGVTLTQVVQTYAGTVPLVAGRNAFIRVFGRANRPNSAAPRVRVRVYNGELLVNTTTLNKAPGVPLSPDQGALESSWNGILAGRFIQPGLRILADIDSEDTIPEGNEDDNTFPAAGTPLGLDVRQMPTLRITFVPIQQLYNLTLIGNISEANKDEFLIDVRRMLPVLDIDTEIHAPYTTIDAVPLTSNDANLRWIRLLNEVNTIRVAESGHHPSPRHYYGVVRVDYSSGRAGYALVGGRAAVGWDHLPSGINITAHELTHNFGRRHAPCGDAPAPDPSYPYLGGTIGVYGYDLLNHELRLPSSFDLMSYCGNPWISDYTYVGAMTWRENNSSQTVAGTALGIGPDAPPRPVLLVWGRVERGKLVLEPAFSIVARPSVPAGGGPYRLEGFARNGRTLFSYDFAGEQSADADDATARLFAFAIPVDESTQAELATIRVSGGGSEPASMHASLTPGGISASVSALTATTRGNGMVNVRWGGQDTRMAMVRDRTTGQVLSFARGSNVDIQASSGDLEVIFSDGVRSVARQVRVGPQ